MDVILDRVHTERHGWCAWHKCHEERESLGIRPARPEGLAGIGRKNFEVEKWLRAYARDFGLRFSVEVFVGVRSFAATGAAFGEAPGVAQGPFDVAADDARRSAVPFHAASSPPKLGIRPQNGLQSPEGAEIEVRRHRAWNRLPGNRFSVVQSLGWYPVDAATISRQANDARVQPNVRMQDWPDYRPASQGCREGRAARYWWAIPKPKSFPNVRASRCDVWPGDDGIPG